MKKITALLALLVAMAIFAGCVPAAPAAEGTAPAPTAGATEPVETESAATTQATEATGEDLEALFHKYFSGILDISHYEIKYGNVTLKEEYRVRDFDELSDSGCVVLDGVTTLYIDETKVSEFLEDGWEFKSDSIAEEIVMPGALMSLTTLKRNGHEIFVGVHNTTKEEQPVKDTVIWTIDIKQYDVSSITGVVDRPTATDFLVDGKITQDSSLRDIIDAYGEPQSVGFLSSYMLIRYGGMHISISFDGNTIYKFEWNR